MLNTITINTPYPCHSKKQVKLSFIIDLVPRQRFERTCPICGLTWDIEATQIKHTDQMTITKQEWTLEKN